MAQYKTSRALSGLRTKNWPAGRAAQLRLAVQRLEEQVNTSLAQSVVQTSSRKVSDQVPFILKLNARAGFKQAQIFWKAPPGLGGHPFRQLLFYEIQHASTEIFFDPITFTTPKTSVTIGGLRLGSFRSFRVRIVNTLGIAGPWSEIKTLRIARSRIQTTDILQAGPEGGVSVRLERNALGQFEKVLEFPYQSLGGSISITMHITMATPHFDINRRVNGVVKETFFGGPAFVQFRTLLGRQTDIGTTAFSTLGASRFILSSRPGYLATATLSTKTPAAFGSIMSPFFKAEDSDILTIRVEAMKMTGSEWKGRLGTGALTTSDPLILIRNIKVLEVLDT